MKLILLGTVPATKLIIAFKTILLHIFNLNSTYIIGENISSCFDGHNVRVLIEHPEGDRAVVLSLEQKINKCSWTCGQSTSRLLIHDVHPAPMYIHGFYQLKLIRVIILNVWNVNYSISNTIQSCL